MPMKTDAIDRHVCRNLYCDGFSLTFTVSLEFYTKISD